MIQVKFAQTDGGGDPSCRARARFTWLLHGREKERGRKVKGDCGAERCRRWLLLMVEVEMVVAGEEQGSGKESKALNGHNAAAEINMREGLGIIPTGVHKMVQNIESWRGWNLTSPLH